MRHWSTSRSKRVISSALAGLLGTLALGSLGPSAAAAPAVPRTTASRPLLPAPAIHSRLSAASDAVVIALFPSELSPDHVTVESILDRLAGHASLALGMASATQAIYDPEQALLDISQGARIQMDRYTPQSPPELDLNPASHGPSAIAGWSSVLARAATAPATALPGLLASSIPDRAAFVGILGGPYAAIPDAANYFLGRPWPHPGAIIAADRSGNVADVSLGTPGSLVTRTEQALVSRRLVVVELSSGASGDSQLGALLAARQPRQLVVALQSPPVLRGSQTLWLGLAGDGRSGTLTSGSTHVHGMVEGTDVTATVLAHLGLPIPSQVQGQPIKAEGPHDPASLKAFRARIGVVNGRQLPSLETFLLAWGGLVLLLGILSDARGVAAGLRAGGLGMLWIPSLALVTASFGPGRLVELAVLAGGALALGAVTDRFVAWPRAPAVPAAVGLLAYTVDLARGSRLIDESVFGPSPLAGVRFYGVDNDLEIVSTLLVLALIAATLRHRDRSHRSATILVGAGLVCALIVCPGRLGADVGGIFTITAGFGAAALMMLPRITWRSVLLALVAPALALVGLAGIDLVTNGNSDFLRNVIGAPNGGDVWNIVQRRYDVAWKILRVGEIPLLSLIALLAAGYAVRHRHRLFAAVAPDALWPACLAGGFAAAVACALFNDSGANELILGTGAVACLAAYVRSPPPASTDASGAIQAGRPGGAARYEPPVSAGERPPVPIVHAQRRLIPSRRRRKA